MKTMITHTLGLCLGIAALLPDPSCAAELEHEFAGTRKCSICHRQAKQGNQYGIWQDSKHAQAFETLGSEKAKAIATCMGIDAPQASGKCLKCHSTAYYYSEAPATEKVAPEEGVTCESCHGPGKDYMRMSTMRDLAAAVAAGLILPDADSCLQCHNEESPTYKPFEFDAQWKKIEHPVPK